MRLHGLVPLVGAVAIVLAALSPGVPPVAVHLASLPTYSYAKAIRQSVWVDTGQHVRVAADIIRPRELDTTAKIPVIMEASPYNGCCGRGNQFQKKAYDAAGNPITFPLFYDNYFVPRGYAVVLVDLAGTNRSQGCVDVGGPSDVRSATSVIDWLNGRASAYTSPDGSTKASAYWSDGSVGMIGKSWDGTIAEGVAATGIAGLKTIVPISAISDWYDYFWANGAPLDRESPAELAKSVESGAACQSVGNGARDYVASEGKVTASVFTTAGLNDDNVLTINVGRWWQALPTSVPKMLWLSQTGHVDPFDFRRAAWVAELHRWFDHYLMGIDNGVQHDPVASIERAPDRWVNYPSWPIPGTTPTTWHLGGTASFTDDPTQSDEYWAVGPTSAAPDRLVYSMGPLRTATTISGTAMVTLTVASSTSDARLSAVLVDYGTTTMRDYAVSGAGIRTLQTKSCWGDSTPSDSACYFDTVPNIETVSVDVFDRGWADVGFLAHQQTLTPGRPYTVTFPLNTTDHTVPAGHTLALIVGGTDGGYIDAPAGRPTLTVNLASSSVLLPLAH